MVEDFFILWEVKFIEELSRGARQNDHISDCNLGYRALFWATAYPVLRMYVKSLLTW